MKAVLTCLVFGLMGFLSSGMAASSGVLLSQDEIEQVLSHGPWPMEFASDPSNAVSGNGDAIRLGRDLFFSPILSADRETRCATCHVPEFNTTDGLPRGQGIVTLDRNTPALFNLRHHRWFGWAGQNDNLWAQSLAPIGEQDEMQLQDMALKEALAGSTFKDDYQALFGAMADDDPQQVLVNTGKALAAYLETLDTGRTPFDDFRDALETGDLDAAASYPAAAQRGLSLFVGKGRCNLCHSGPLFSNGEFHDAGVPYFIEPGRVDSGRHGGIKNLRDSPYTLNGAYSDDLEKSGAWAVLNVIMQHSNFGTFRVPSLRSVAETAPYMHNGSLSTLEDVANHYSNIDMERLHADGEALLRPLNLSDNEIHDLVQFLKSLSGPLPQLQ
jgi:cytochrome c peroxidase